MAELTLNENQINQFEALNNLFEGSNSSLSNILTFDNLINEAYVLNTLESSIPESLKFDLHVDMILESRVTDYYKSMTDGTNYILEAARKIFPNSQHITESIESFKEYLVSMLNEDALTLAMPTGAEAVAAPLTARTGGGFWGTLKSLWNAITEGGSAIGILHFVIDIIGLLGTALPPVGMIADLINAIIYAVRGEWILCSINLISALVFGAGQFAKTLKWAAKPASRVLKSLIKTGGAKSAAEELGKLGAKESSGVMKLLTFISGNIASVVAKASSVLGAFFVNFGKYTKWIPGLGSALSYIFKGLGSVLSKFGESMSLFSSNLKLMTSGAKTAAKTSMRAVFQAGGDIAFDGPWVKLMSKEGKVVGKYPVKFYEKLTVEELAELTAKKAGSSAGAKILYPTAEAMTKATAELADPIVNQSILRKAVRWIGKGLKISRQLSVFIGKQVYKIIFKSDWIEGQSKWTKDEVEGHGNGALNSWINAKIAKEKAESGATYIPFTTLDGSDKESRAHITDYQNHYAKELNQPLIMNVVYDKYNNEKTTSEFDDFFDAIGKGKIKYGKSNDRVDHSTSDQLDASLASHESKNTAFKSSTILNFSDFKK